MKQALKYLVIHCTATPEGREVTANDIRMWHTAQPPKGRGWKQVGYTDLVHLDGKIERLVDNNNDDWVDPREVTNGAAGYNSVSRHIVYAGGLSADGKTAKDTRTNAQKEALKRYVTEFRGSHPTVKILGHRDLPGVYKACPSFGVFAWLKSIGITQ